MRWKIRHIGGTIFQAEEGESVRLIDAHCLACAKLFAFNHFGGDVDLRGWHNQGECGKKMKEIVQRRREEANNKIE
jgi:hypothetical protein